LNKTFPFIVIIIALIGITVWPNYAYYSAKSLLGEVREVASQLKKSRAQKSEWAGLIKSKKNRRHFYLILNCADQAQNSNWITPDNVQFQKQEQRILKLAPKYIENGCSRQQSYMLLVMMFHLREKKIPEVIYLGQDLEVIKHQTSLTSLNYWLKALGLR
jgi:hypothetical protein